MQKNRYADDGRAVEIAPRTGAENSARKSVKPECSSRRRPLAGYCRPPEEKSSSLLKLGSPFRVQSFSTSVTVRSFCWAAVRPWTNLFQNEESCFWGEEWNASIIAENMDFEPEKAGGRTVYESVVDMKCFQSFEMRG